MSVYIDSSALLTIIDADDPNHPRARSTWADIVRSQAPLVTSNYVLLETTAVLQKRFGLSAVRLLSSEIVPVLNVVWVEAELHSAALSAVLAGGRHGPSLVDWVGFEIVTRRGIGEVFAYDAHFADRDFTLVGQVETQ